MRGTRTDPLGGRSAGALIIIIIFISASQPGPGAALGRLPDPAVRRSVVPSDNFITQVERHAGLYISVLQPTLDARAARGQHVTQHERLGDAAINAANATHRHNECLHATATALRAAATAGSVQLGDKGDGTAASKSEARQRYAHINAGHVPDIIHARTLYEIKVFTPFTVTQALGHGSAAKGGAPSTSDGRLFAFGNTR